MKRSVYLLLAGGALLLVAGFARLRLDTDVLNLMPSGDPVVSGLKEYQRHFTESDELILALEGTDPDLAESAARELAEFLRARPGLTRQVVWQAPWLEHPAEASEWIAYLWLNQPPGEVIELRQRLEGEALEKTLRESKRQLATSLSPGELARRAYDPLQLMDLPQGLGDQGMDASDRLFSSADGTFRLLFVRAPGRVADYRAARQWLEALRAAWREWLADRPEYASLRWHFTGAPAFAVEIASGMERDLSGPSAATLLVIALLFYAVHRRIVPLLWLILLLVASVAGTLALGGLLFGTLNVVSLGFASILLGLGEDFGIVLYQESKVHPAWGPREVRRVAWKGIVWSAVTTAAAFLALHFGGLPGLAQLGTLVAAGVLLAAAIMLGWFLAPLLPHPARARAAKPAGPFPWFDGRRRWAGFAAAASLMLLGLGIWNLVSGGLRFDASPEALHPRKSAAHESLREMRRRMDHEKDPVWILAEGGSPAAVHQQLEKLQPMLQSLRQSGAVADFRVPLELWPHTDRQQQNRPVLLEIAAARERLAHAAAQAGFTPQAMEAAGRMFDTWVRAASASLPFWPDSPVSRWSLDRFAAREGNRWLALASVQPAQPFHLASPLPPWAGMLPQGVRLTGWELLGPSVSRQVIERTPLLIGLIGGIVLIALWAAFRSWRDVLLSLTLLLFSAAALAAVMRLLDWRWNMLNLMALPLLLGLGIDYALHIQLALRRHAGNLQAVFDSVGKALLLAGATTITGFGALSFASNAGIGSLGRVCALGIATTLLAAVFLLPFWWRWTHPRRSSIPSEPGARPSALYRSWFWELAILMVRRIPESQAIRWTQALCRLYARWIPSRREAVVENLLPVAGGRTEAEAAARRLFDHFGTKLVHLWRYEAGLPIDACFGELQGQERFAAARQSGRGILLLTPHLGNWEFGAPLLVRHGVRLLVITLYEPNARLTEIRQQSRARWGIETLVVGQDPFAFVEVIRRLEEGAVVALLMDRPPAGSAVTVTLFGRPFEASLSAAELARATGCILLPVVLPWNGGSYDAHVLPEIPYERQKLDRKGRQELTQEILRAFEPEIRQHLDQWYHFVPVWKRAEHDSP